ncbi:MULTISPECIES: DUF6247 family protein [unclassified Streptomyces]|uniref:DUF6247 family protein n=1 Tax=unclassified Streptomyces TaxID=2593676 RepID=UPI000A80B086|nr:DUF6247 family protein [Streptomyces sp. TSRI0281]
MPAFDRQWKAALEESRRAFSLAELYEVVQDGQGRLAHAPAIGRVRRLRLRRQRVHRHGGAAGKAPVSGQPYAVRFSAPAAKVVLDTLPQHVEGTVWGPGVTGAHLPVLSRRR